ncbi:MAG: histone deacetylase family protein [Chloroflexi bacterium]|nr:histone deacetylase family protein [Chloroflexota bacterium]
MKIFHSEIHRRHNPPFEVFDGGRRVPYLESPARMDHILSALRKTNWADIKEPADFGLDPILAVHDSDYLKFLASAWDEWQAPVSEFDFAPDNSALLPATFALRRHPHKPKSLLGRAGYYMMDLSAVIVKGTYEAALSSTNCALTGAQAIIEGEPVAFALCRPPGHHAGKDYAAGYCFINNAAVAANELSSKDKVVILDIDYHAGNGTQDIFYNRSDVLTISIHADPAYEYPYYAGYEDEIGSGQGKGFHHNFPLPSGTDDLRYLAVLERAIGTIKTFKPKYLIVSAGVDIYDGDPFGTFKITRQGIRQIGTKIANLELPTLFVMEGGYANEALGENVVALLESFVR